MATPDEDLPEAVDPPPKRTERRIRLEFTTSTILNGAPADNEIVAAIRARLNGVLPVIDPERDMTNASSWSIIEITDVRPMKQRMGWD